MTSRYSKIQQQQKKIIKDKKDKKKKTTKNTNKKPPPELFAPASRTDCPSPPGLLPPRVLPPASLSPPAPPPWSPHPPCPPSPPPCPQQTTWLASVCLRSRSLGAHAPGLRGRRPPPPPPARSRTRDSFLAEQTSALHGRRNQTVNTFFMLTTK